MYLHIEELMSTGSLEQLCAHTVSGLTLDSFQNKNRGIQYITQTSLDARCMAEHDFLGSTIFVVDNPWIPYALLAGRSIEEVNTRRAREKEQVVYHQYFDLPINYIVFCTVPLADLTTGEIATPTICRVVSAHNDLPINESIWCDKHYVGPHLR